MSQPLAPTEQPNAEKPRRRWWKWLIYPGIIAVVFFLVLFARAASSDQSFWQYVSETYIQPTVSFTQTLSAMTASTDETLVGAQDDRVNVLLLGTGGPGHDGPNLTDTIIVASYKPSTHQVAFLSIPRDLLIPIPGYGWRKINNLYAFAEANDPGTGGDYTKQIISQIFGIQIPYYLRIDFSGFTQLVDLLGGVDINVPRTLSDYQYPVEGKEDAPDDQRYEHLYIEAGQQHMDGETALKYVRSRHAEGPEGTDFARAARQQLVIEALMGKIFSFNTLLNPSKIKKIEGNIQDNIDTDLSFADLTAFAKLASQYMTNRTAMINRVLTSDVNGPLQEATYNGAFTLEPKVDDFSELKFIASNLFDPDAKYNRPTEDPSGLPHVVLQNPVKAEDKATIEIQNGTFVHGLAHATQEKLAGLGYKITSVSNAVKQDTDKTIIYDFSNGKFPGTLKFLAGNYTDNITNKIPLGVTSSANFLIVLGLDSAY